MSNNGFIINNGVPYLAGNQPVVSGNSLINYIVNTPDAESGLGSWVTYSNTAQNIPVTGAGSSASGITLTRSTSSPLHGVASFLITQSSSTNVQGQGVSYSFTIDAGDQAKMLQIAFDYNASSTFVAADGVTAPKTDGTTSTSSGNSDIEVFIYDVTNAVLVPVVPFVIVSNGANNFNFRGYFQTASNSISYRLIFHCATTNANVTGYTFKFDNVFVGTQAIAQGAAITDWVSFTPSGQQSSNATYTGYWRRVGDSMEILAEIDYSGSTSGFTTINIPFGLSIDSNKITTGSGGQKQSFGIAQLNTGSVAYVGDVSFNGSTQVLVWGPSNAAWTASNPSTIGSGYAASFHFTVPIVGWSSNVQLSNDADTRVVAAKALGDNVIRSYSSSTPLQYNTVSYDTHGALTTGSSWRYTAPVSGIYELLITASNEPDGGKFVYKNGSLDGWTGVPNNTNATGNYQIKLTAGDFIDLRGSSSGTFSVTSTQDAVAIKRLSGPAVIANTETVAMVTTSPSGTPTSSYTLANFQVVNFDTHSGYSTSSGTYTIPVSGLYNITAQLDFNGGVPAGATFWVAIYQNGSQVGYNTQSAGGNDEITPILTRLYKCSAGDLIEVEGRYNGAVSGATWNGTSSFLSLYRIK